MPYLRGMVALTHLSLVCNVKHLSQLGMNHTRANVLWKYDLPRISPQVIFGQCWLSIILQRKVGNSYFTIFKLSTGSALK